MKTYRKYPIICFLNRHNGVSQASRYDYTLGESLNNRIFFVRDPVTKRSFATSNATIKLAVHCLIVNSPQLSISIFYFAFSSLYSALFQAKYWAGFSVRAQVLRVSYPDGEQQKGTPALQFPWVWGLSFVLLKAAIGWSLTQSFYLVPIGSKWYRVSFVVYSYIKKPIQPVTKLRTADTWLSSEVSMWLEDFHFDNVDMFIGYSMKAMVLTIAVAAVAISIPILLSIRRLPPASVVVGTDSAAIAAYCPTNVIGIRHQGVTEGRQVAVAAWDDVWRSRRHLQPLRWGVLNLGSATLGRPGVLGLGTESEVLGPPVEGQMYVSVAGHFKLYVPSALEVVEASR